MRKIIAVLTATTTIWTLTVVASAESDIANSGGNVQVSVTAGSSARKADFGRVAYNSVDDEFLSVWRANPDPLDMNKTEIFGQRMDADGQLLGSEIRVTTSTGSGIVQVGAPAVAYDSANNEYLVVYHSDELVNNVWELYGQYLSGDGIVAEEEPILISATDIGETTYYFGGRLDDSPPPGGASSDLKSIPALAYSPETGNFLVAWSGDTTYSPYVAGEYEIWSRIVYGLDHTMRSTIQPVSDAGAGLDGPRDIYDAFDPDVIWDAARNRFALVWHEDVTLSQKREIMIAQINADGSDVVPQHIVKVSEMGPIGDNMYEAVDPEIALGANDAASNGDYLVVWKGDEEPSANNNEFEIWSRVIRSSDLVTIGLGQVQLTTGLHSPPASTNPTGVYRPTVDYNSVTNEFLVTYTADDLLTPSLDRSIRGRMVDASVPGAFSAPVGTELIFTDLDLGGADRRAERSSVAFNPTSNTFLAVWQDNRAPQDLAKTEIWSQLVHVVAAPSAPLNVVATKGDAAVGLVWDAPAMPGGTITNYTVTATSTGGDIVWPDPVASEALTFTGLTNGTAYTFTVVATNATGDSAASAASNSVTPDVVPAQPAAPSAAKGDTVATVSWVAPVDNGGSAITGYTVTASPAPAVDSASKSAGTTSPYEFTGLTNGVSYTFTVMATNAEGPGLASDASAAVIPSGMPGTPSDVVGMPGDKKVNLSWTGATSNGSAISGYTVTRSPGGVTYPVVGDVNSLAITGLSNGTAYSFTVKATNGNGSGSASAASIAVTPSAVPFAPTNVVAVPGDGLATVSWTAANNNGSAITGYTVTASPGGATVTAGGSTTSVVFPGLMNEVGYTFTVKATNANGTGPSSDASASVSPSGLPGAPTNVVAVPGDEVATVSWTAASNNGSAITGYTVTASPGGATVTAGGSATSVEFPGLMNDVGYTFTVTATNANGTGPASVVSLTVVPESPIPDGWWLIESSGVIYEFGEMSDLGDIALVEGRRAIDIDANSAATGLWVLDSVGQVHVRGAATNFGNADGSVLGVGESFASLSPTPSDLGYWIFTDRGRVFAFGDAKGYGDLLDLSLNGRIVSSISTPTGLGYWMLGADGGVFAFGDAGFYGSTGSMTLNEPVVGIVPDPDGVGYWLVAQDGGVFAFDAPFVGSLPGVVTGPLNAPINGMIAYGDGYLMIASDGGVFNFSTKAFAGSLGGVELATPIIGIAAVG